MKTLELPRAMSMTIPNGTSPEDTSLPPAKVRSEPIVDSPAASDVRPTKPVSLPNAPPSDAQDLPLAMARPKPKVNTPAAPSLRPARITSILIIQSPGASNSSASAVPDPGVESPRGGDGGGHTAPETHRASAPAVYLQLRIWAEMYEDAQKARIACANRIERGGVDSGPYLGQLAAMEAAEHGVGLGMRRCYRLVVDPQIVAWQKNTRGIGEHLLARLLGIIGHPVHTTAHHWEGAGEDRELIDDGPMDRSVSQLWSYCGNGDVTRKRRTGMMAEEAAAMGNPRAKMVVHLIAESVVKARGPHRVFYDERRIATEDREWTAGHSHNDALRILGKAILKDLWLASGGSTAGEGGQSAPDTQPFRAPLVDSANGSA